MRTVRAQINYLGPMTERPVFCGPDMPGTTLRLAAETVDIRDARTLPAAPSLDREGFALVRHPTSLRDFQDKEELDRSYGAEIAQLIGSVSGATEVRAVPGATGRFVDRNDLSKARATLPAGRFVHWDYTDLSARTVFLPQIMEPDAAFKRFRRIVVYQTWRALSGPSQDVPLALSDGRTVSQSDLVACDVGRAAGGEADGNPKYGAGQPFEFSVCRFNPGHRWYYYPDMRMDELLIFKGYDFDPGRTQRVVHTAFDDPTAAPDAPPRASVEVRVFAFFE